jgi:lipopolysaccharide transport system ATP-binding protein
MTRGEIQRKLDEIVAFSGVEKFLDTPVKRYSSGMHVRLAFSVAAHLEPEMLLVDEVLAVGDAEFQRKCLGKMRDVTTHGRTVLFVSHNMSAIRNLCSRVILLEHGSVAADGPAADVVTEYLQKDFAPCAVASGGELERRLEKGSWGKTSRDVLTCREIAVLDARGRPRDQFSSDEEVTVAVVYECSELHHDFRLIVSIGDEENPKLMTTQSSDAEGEALYSLPPGTYRSWCIIPANLFGEKRLHVSVSLVLPHVTAVTFDRILAFDVSFAGYNNVQYMSLKESLLRPRLSWHTDRVSATATAPLPSAT